MKCWVHQVWGRQMADPVISSVDIKRIQAAFMQFDRRAEKVSQEILTRTFVDAEPLFIQLSSKNHQVLYGRRGTGKTHALKFLAEKISEQGETSIYVDLRAVGSNG
jgi:Cdc6-like AAA superfamily ATPase